MTDAIALTGCTHGIAFPSLCPNCFRDAGMLIVIAPGQRLLEYQRALATRLTRGAVQ